MKLTEEEMKELENMSKPLIDWLYEHGTPHSLITICQDGVIVYAGEIGIPFKPRD